MNDSWVHTSKLAYPLSTEEEKKKHHQEIIKSNWLCTQIYLWNLYGRMNAYVANKFILNIFIHTFRSYFSFSQINMLCCRCLGTSDVIGKKLRDNFFVESIFPPFFRTCMKMWNTIATILFDDVTVVESHFVVSKWESRAKLNFESERSRERSQLKTFFFSCSCTQFQMIFFPSFTPQVWNIFSYNIIIYISCDSRETEIIFVCFSSLNGVPHI